MTFDDVLGTFFGLAAVAGAVAGLVFWIKVRKRSPGAAIEQIRRLAADSEGSRPREWQELADEICAQVFPDADPQELKAIFARYRFKFSKNHGFAHDAPVDVVADVVKRLFPSIESDVWAILRTYDTAILGIPVARIQLDILKASGGRFEALTPLVKQAKEDVRDFLVFAETPSTGRVLTHALKAQSADKQAVTVASGDLGEQIHRAAHENLREFVAWHKGLPALPQPVAST